MGKSKEIIVPKGGMINLSRHEDDDALIANKPLVARVIDDSAPDATKVVIEEVDPDREFYIHKPDGSSKK